MTPDELPRGQRHRLTLVLVAGSAPGGMLQSGDLCTLYPDDRAGDALLRCREQVWAVEAADDASDMLFREVLERRRPSVSWIAGAMRDGAGEHVLVDISEYPEGMSTPDALDFGVDDRIVVEIGEHFLHRAARMPEVLEWLGDELLSPGPASGSSYLVLSDPPRRRDQHGVAFRIFGRSLAVDVQGDEHGRLRLVRAVRARRNAGDAGGGRTVLLQAAARFVDSASAARFGGAMQETLDQLVAGGASYLEFWSEYNRIEESLLLRRARSMGWLSYSRRESLGDGRWRFYALEDEDLMAWVYRVRDLDEDELATAPTPPPELTAETGDPLLDSDATSTDRRRERRHARRFAGRLVGSDRRTRSVDIQGRRDEDERLVPPEKGVLFMSLAGGQTMVERRREAERRIARGEAPMGMRLRALLEDVPTPELRVRREQPLSPAARAALGGSPTDRQREALDVALNTPDIALIQGPPGTGKTAVIAALQTRLAELADRRHTMSGRMLLSSVQHEAVEHAAARTEVFGLPAVKIGMRRGSETRSDDRVQRWAEERIDQISADLAGLEEKPRYRVLREVRALVNAYLVNPGDPVETAHLLRRVASLVEAHVPAAPCDALRERARLLEARQSASGASAETESRELILRAVRGLRTDPGSFADDGPVMARRAAVRLHGAAIATEADLALLERAADWASDVPPPFLDELAALRDRCTDALVPGETSAFARALDEASLGCLREASQALEEVVRQTPDAVPDVLAEFVHELRNDPRGVERMLREYTVVLASTCQQAASHRLATAKHQFAMEPGEPPDREGGTTFETVIIDEAARANPLDLLIPMSMGQRRIILVGDHRQLPHMLEPEVERELEGALSTDARAAIRQSLFERLFLALRRRQLSDGINRTVTLDTQFRMHPALGVFVSRTFYERHDAGAVIKAGRPEEEFGHDLPGVEGACAAWIDVPLSHGPESSGRSRTRPVEARVVAEWVKRFADHRPDLSFGVIGFYAAQVETLWEACVRNGLAQVSETGGFELLREYRETRSRDGRRADRVRIGTVDSMQGKEFDVVFLSLTRSNDVFATDAATQRRKYGFLALENRLCVAMSRQQRLLVVVGDSAMAEGAGAESAVPALPAFLSLCRGPQGRVLA